MFRSLFGLLLLNILGRSFVSPLPTPTKSNGSLVSDLLTTLAIKCEQPFLSAQINSKLKDCSIQLTPFNEKQFECLTFYDINNQLCDAVATAKLALTVNDTAKLEEPVDIDNLCSMANHWNVTDIDIYPNYKNTVERIFKSQSTCVKVCGVADILSQDVNAFCKYFKWGADILSTRVIAVSNSGDIYVAHPSDHAIILGNNTPNLTEPSKVVTANTPEVKSGEAVGTDAVKPVVNIQQWSTNKEEPAPEIPKVSLKTPLESNSSASSAPQKMPADSPSNIGTVNAEMEKPSAAEVPPVKKDDVKLEELPKNLSGDEKEPTPGNEKSKLQNEEPEDYQGDLDLEDTKDLTLSDTQGGDDGEDPILSDPDLKQDLPKKPSKKIESMVSYNNGEMELFPNAMQEGFSDDDDHFFSFFLTAVVLVVLLYVLYHNKNKVSKVVLGLIVEGRQSGRRRNSRGHAYRRLDTLEQAMSANTAAPPSKIIY